MPPTETEKNLLSKKSIHHKNGGIGTFKTRET